MSDFLEIFGVFDFLVRESLILLLIAFSIYVLLKAGMFALPQVGFMAIGGYVAAILQSDYGVPMAGRLLGAALAAALAGLVLGLILARLDGIYLAIATIGFSEIVRVVARNLEITGGAIGISGLDRTLPDVLVVGFAGLAVLVLGRLAYTRFGLAMTAIREDELTAAHQGINIRSYRVGLFVLSGLMAGTAGGLHIHLRGFIEPNLFSFGLLVTLLTVTVVGGMTSVIGPILGGVLIFSLPQVLRAVEEYRSLVNGVLLVLVIAFAPSGLVEFPRRAGRRLLDRLQGRRHPATDRPAGDQRPEPSIAVNAASDSANDNAGTPGESVLTISGLSKNFGGLQALRDVDLDVTVGEVLGLIGPNGSGKTTLLNLLSGVYRPDSGMGVLLGQSMADVWGRPDLLAQAGVSRTFQTIRLIEGHSVAQNVTAGAYLRERSSIATSILGVGGGREERERVRTLVDETLAAVGLTEVATTDVDALPYGLQRRVEIARSLVRNPGLLLLDEPTAGMTPSERDDIFALIEKTASTGIGVVVVEHDVHSMTANCDQLVVLNFGEVIAMGDPEAVIREEAVIDAYIGSGA